MKIMFFASLCFTSFSVLAFDMQQAAKKATVCASCHGIDGIGTRPDYPNLAGQKKQYLINSLKAYKSGLRRNSIMGPMAKVLSDEDIVLFAEYYSKLKGTSIN